MFLQRDFSQLEDLAAIGTVLTRGDALTSFQFDVSKEGKAHIVIDGSFIPKVPNAQPATDGIPNHSRCANVRAIMKNDSGSVRVLIAHKSAMNNPRFRAIEPILTRLVYGDGGLVLRNDPLGRFMHTFAGRTAKMHAFASTRKGPVEDIGTPEGSDGEYTATEEALIGTFGTTKVWAVPFSLIEEAKLTGQKARWTVAYERKSAFAWASRPLRSGAIVFGRYGETAMDAHAKSMIAQAFMPVHGSDGRILFEPLPEIVQCGGKNAMAFEGLTAGGSAKDLYAVFRPFGEAATDASLPIVKPLADIQDPAWQKLIEAAIRSN